MGFKMYNTILHNLQCMYKEILSSGHLKVVLFYSNHAV